VNTVAAAAEQPLAAAGTRWLRRFPHRVRLVLHAGTPKTGTTALQQALFRNRDALASRGIWYPPARVDPVQKKHQFLVELLLAGDETALAAAFDDIVGAAPPETHTLVLSTEGVFNHWWDYPLASRAMLEQLGVPFALEIWTCFREPLAFTLSQYVQLLRNPRSHAPAYGLDIGLDEMLDNAWFVKRLDYVGYVRETEAVVGANNVRLFRYGSDITTRFFRALGAPDPLDVPGDVNPSLRAPGVALMRAVNRYALPPAEQHAASALVQQIEAAIGDRAEPFRAGVDAERRIRELTAAGWSAIEPRLDVA
jgi:hypothetical protein